MVKRSSLEFRIPFTGLKVGKHHYEFAVGDTFFEAFDYSEIEKANLKVAVDLEKQSSMLVVDFQLGGTVEVSCDRCGDEIEQVIDGRFKLVVKFGPETGSTDDDVLILGTNENDLDLSQFIYEYTHLALPARRVHATMAACNQEMLESLNRYKLPVSESEDAEEHTEEEE